MNGRTGMPQSNGSKTSGRLAVLVEELPFRRYTFPDWFLPILAEDAIGLRRAIVKLADAAFGKVAIEEVEAAADAVVETAQARVRTDAVLMPLHLEGCLNGTPAQIAALERLERGFLVRGLLPLHTRATENGEDVVVRSESLMAWKALREPQPVAAYELWWKRWALMLRWEIAHKRRSGDRVFLARCIAGFPEVREMLAVLNPDLLDDLDRAFVPPAFSSRENLDGLVALPVDPRAGGADPVRLADRLVRVDPWMPRSRKRRGT